MASNVVAVSEKTIEPRLISYLPIDLIEAEILPKLDPKSLIRFKTVCKSFNAIISSPEFIDLHLRHSLSSNNRFLVTNRPCSDHIIDMYDLNSHSSVPTATFWWPWDAYILGSCNGLLLISVTSHYADCLHLVLLNPSTRTYVELHSEDRDVVNGNIGFGFDDHSNDYKIVAVSHISNRTSTWRVTSVYSVNLKSWKVVDRALTSDSLTKSYTRHNGLLISNHLLHWIFESSYGYYQRIGCFDVIDEEWIRDIHFPDHYYNCRHKGEFLDVGVLDGCLFTSFVNRVDLLFDVWVMKEYGVQESWIKLLSVNIGNDPSGELVPIAKLFNESTNETPGGVVPGACCGPGSSEVLHRNRIRSNKLFWYNWVDNAVIKPEIPVVWGHQPYFVKPSLVRLPNANPNLFGDMYIPDLYASHLQR